MYSGVVPFMFSLLTEADALRRSCAHSTWPSRQLKKSRVRPWSSGSSTSMHPSSSKAATKTDCAPSWAASKRASFVSWALCKEARSTTATAIL
eukprot:971521-Prymnesium_polylepis.3